MLYDTHAHLDMISEDYLPILIKNAKAANVKTIITNTVNINSLNKSLQIKKTYLDIVKLAAGLYPEDTLKSKDYDKLEKIILKNKSQITAIGEIGLDKTEKLDFKIQKQVFIKQLGLAKQLNLPVIIHTRKAELEVLEVLQNYPNLIKILHCFSGKKKLIKRAEEMGCYFSIPTNIVRSQQFQEMAKEVSKEKILTETDTPYLSPFKEKQNEPSHITETIKTLSNLWNLPIIEVEKQIEKNFNKIFSK